MRPRRSPPWRRRRAGLRNVVTAFVAGVAVFGLARAAVPGALLLLFLLTLPIGVGRIAGCAAAGSRSRSASRTARCTCNGVCTSGFNLGAAVSSLIAVPTADAFSGWRAALLSSRPASTFRFAAWLFLTPAVRAPQAAAPLRASPWGMGVVWGLAAVFALQSIVYYGLVSWMPDSFLEKRGWSAEPAARCSG